MHKTLVEMICASSPGMQTVALIVLLFFSGSVGTLATMFAAARFIEKRRASWYDTGYNLGIEHGEQRAMLRRMFPNYVPPEEEDSEDGQKGK